MPCLPPMAASCHRNILSAPSTPPPWAINPASPSPDSSGWNAARPGKYPNSTALPHPRPTTVTMATSAILSSSSALPTTLPTPAPSRPSTPCSATPRQSPPTRYTTTSSAYLTTRFSSAHTMPPSPMATKSAHSSRPTPATISCHTTKATPLATETTVNAPNVNSSSLWGPSTTSTTPALSPLPTISIATTTVSSTMSTLW